MSSAVQIKPGDTVAVRAKVLKVGHGDTGMMVELFSKTDQFTVWIRSDFVVAHTPRPPIPDEPGPGAYHFSHPDLDEPLTVLRAGDSWTSGDSDWMEFEDFWELFGGPGVIITPLEPAPSEVVLPWEYIERDGSRIVVERPMASHAGPGDVFVRTTEDGVYVSGEALAAVARAARSQS